MSLTIKPAPVRRTVDVPATPARAFEVFTAGFDRWWPRTHSIGDAPMKEGILEGRSGGRWYSILEDGTECEWGDVLAWEPPTRVLLAWRINADWKYDPRLLTEVEVTFAPEGAGTRVTLEHRLIENMGEKAETVAAMVGAEGGWSGILKQFAAAVAAG
jgi:uncharacterized protein YndB with AHSA1/START domain